MVTSRPVSCCRCRVTEPLLSSIMRQAGDRSAVGAPSRRASSLLPCTSRFWLSKGEVWPREELRGHTLTTQGMGGTGTALSTALEPDEGNASQLP